MPVLRLALILALLTGIDSTNTQRVSPDRPGTAADTPATDHAVGYYDERLQRVVLVGGVGDPKVGDRDKVWSWSGTRWERVTDEGPASRVNASAAYDARRGKAVVAGGSRKADGNWEVVGDSWWSDEVGWRKIADIAPRDHHSLVEDGRGGILLFGGIPADRSVRGRPIPGRSRMMTGSASTAMARPGAAGQRWSTTASAGAWCCSAASAHRRDRSSRKSSSATRGPGTAVVGTKRRTVVRVDDTPMAWSSTNAPGSSCSIAALRPTATRR